MAAPNPQPILPAEGLYTETERLFIAEEPPTTFPSNQHSNWGLLRAVLTDEVQDVVDDLNALFNEIFIDTATAYLSDWETQMGLPISTALTDSARRTSLASRRTRSPFTRTRLKTLVERYISDTFGPPATFGAAGIPLTSAGIPLYATAGSVPSLYRIYENPKTFTVEVWVNSSVVPSAALLRELQWILPAHYTLVFDNAHANILDYTKTILDDQPLMFYSLDTDGTDLSGNSQFPGTVVGSVTFAQGPLISAATVSPGTSAAFNGVTGAITIPDSTGTWPFTSMTAGTEISFEAWVKLTAYPASGTFATIFGKGALLFGVSPLGQPVLVGAVTMTANSTLALNTNYHIVATNKAASGSVPGSTHFYVNGAEVSFVGGPTSGTVGGPAAIGRWPSGGGQHYLQGYLDEVAVYDRVLTPAEVLNHYNTGMNIA